MKDFINKYIANSKVILEQLDVDQISKMVSMLKETREKEGRLFILGVGGGAGHASHAVNDFRKICGIEAYSPSDNVSELTARVNDDGWDTSYVNWLMGSRLKKNDSLLVFSVGGGNLEKSVSVNIVKSLQYAKEKGSKVCGIVGRDGGYTAEIADACVIVPPIDSENITPHTEGFQALVWHLLVSHPDLKKFEMKWESVN
ncbi:SIS domain-containing protein [Candidatus Pseudothioglobus singularis]|jgi:D-sedoheptulose 7-phosphate isomerase|nr:SIS domain-containing protein [Candidatus Pseudothioglobus singularis]